MIQKATNVENGKAMLKYDIIAKKQRR